MHVELGISAPVFTEFPGSYSDDDSEDEFDSSPYVPLTEKAIKRQLRPEIKNLFLPPVKVDLLDTSCV